jgi:hypothetical protein
MRVSRIVAVGASMIVGAVVVSGAGTAHADPINSPNAFGPFPVVCDNGVTYQVVGIGNGAFTPAHDVNSTSTLIPTAFGPFHGVVMDLEGNVLDEFTDPAQVKGSSTKDRATSTSCTFTVEFTDFVPEFGEVVQFVGTGTVEGFVTPVR